MLNTKPHTVTRGVDSEAVTLVFYPDTGCLRFADWRGVCHELRPPYSWLAMACASRGVRNGAQAVRESLNVMLDDFCMKRPRWMCGPAHATAHVTVQALGHAHAAFDSDRASADQTNHARAYLSIPAKRHAPFNENMAVTQ